MLVSQATPIIHLGHSVLFMSMKTIGDNPRVNAASCPEQIIGLFSFVCRVQSGMRKLEEKSLYCA